MIMDSMKLFSKIIDTANTQIFNQYRVTRRKFESESELEVFDFLTDYINRTGKTPTLDEVAASCPNFLYLSTNESFDELVSKINSKYAKLELIRMIQGKAFNEDQHERNKNLESILHKEDGKELLKFIKENIEQLEQDTNTSPMIGKSIKNDVDWFKKEYSDREQGKSIKVWPSSFPSLNKVLGGGYLSGNYYTFIARSGRGKSIILAREALEAAKQGATVLIWALEMPLFEFYSRLYSMYSAEFSDEKKRIDGIEYSIGFSQRNIVMAKMNDDERESFFHFLEHVNENLSGNIYVRGIDDPNWRDKSLRQLEADILNIKANFVVIDPIYLLQLEKNTSRKTGGDLEATSIKLRSLIGRLNVPLLTCTQADEEGQKEDEEGYRELSPPKRKELKKSKAILEDSSLVVSLDTVDSRGVLVPTKSRGGGEEEPIEITFLPNFGIIKELPKDGIDEYFDLISVF
jgi:replicative DNA helicase